MRSLRHFAAPTAQRSEPSDPPDRYVIEQEANTRYLYCRDTPEVKVRIERSLAVAPAAARKAAEGSIFLDGAVPGEPFIDPERRVFNLDHHEGCVRAFTLSTCEQALVLVLRGLDLRERTWTVYANEPDLDTVLAIWVLLNSTHLVGEDSRVRDAAIPLLRLEGIADSHGPELAELSGFPAPLLAETRQRLTELRQEELALKQAGTWSSVDPLEFTAGQLRHLDRLLYPERHFEGFPAVEVLARAELSEHRVAVVCRSPNGVFETEADLKRLYGKRLGVLVLQKDAHSYSLRQVDPFLPATLEAVYARLNILDPAVRSASSTNRWGGSTDIGGSPRQGGTRLSPQEIAEACRQALRRPSWRERTLAVVLATGAAALSLTGPALRLLAAHFPALRRVAELQSAPLLSAVWMSLVTLLLLVPIGRRRPRLYGARLPGGSDWLRVAPLAVLGTLAGGAWVVPPSSFGVLQVAAFLVFPFAAEITFRSLVHGILGHAFAVQHAGGRWFLSWPTLLSALLYALVTPLLSFPAVPVINLLGPVLPIAGALVFGLAAGAARERSGSALGPLLLHWCCALLALAVALSLR